jgi:phosphoglycolate phosphatase-like HAD superfamily hydrolase
MRDVLGLGTVLGYCTNVHAGATFQEMIANLGRYAVPVKKLVSPKEPMGVGLWLSQPALIDLTRSRNESALSEQCARDGLMPFTFNAFPYGDFHQPVVKHAVYEPAWDQQERAGYTMALAVVLSKLAGPGDERSISTLPIGWNRPKKQVVDLDRVIFNLHMVTSVLSNLYANTGVLIHLDLEPEPGCILQRSEDVVQFFKLLLHDAEDEEQVRTHIRVCHDICHAAVMFEDQKEMFERYRSAGIKIGKVQISNAIRADLRNYSAAERVEALAQLRQFAEDRYLHQTMIDTGAGLRFFDDLPEALREYSRADRAGDEWRIHFHVPVYLEQFDLLGTTRDRIIECMRVLKNSDVKHWEVETYAWNVLPEELKVPDLAEGIARELQWVRQQAEQIA